MTTKQHFSQLSIASQYLGENGQVNKEFTFPSYRTPQRGSQAMRYIAHTAKPAIAGGATEPGHCVAEQHNPHSKPRV